MKVNAILKQDLVELQLSQKRGDCILNYGSLCYFQEFFQKIINSDFGTYKRSSLQTGITYILGQNINWLGGPDLDLPRACVNCVILKWLWPRVFECNLSFSLLPLAHIPNSDIYFNLISNEIHNFQFFCCMNVTTFNSERLLATLFIELSFFYKLDVNFINVLHMRFFVKKFQRQKLQSCVFLAPKYWQKMHA